MFFAFLHNESSGADKTARRESRREPAR